MRKIDKSPNVPQSLRTAKAPTSKADIVENIYKAPDVRDQLIKDQHYKCAYCERAITKSYCDVEHYRPKSHYFWLAYDWQNLLYACNICNRSLKKEQFPLRDNTYKANLPKDKISSEKPLLINPSEVDPSIHIKFRRYMAVEDDRSPECIETIRVFDLNNQMGKQSELVSERENRYEEFELELNKIKIAKAAISKPDSDLSTRTVAQQLIDLCNLSIAKFTSPSSEYSGMLIAQII